MARNRNPESDRRSPHPADDAEDQPVSVATARPRSEARAADRDEDGHAEAGTELESRHSASPASAPRRRNRLVAFVQGSWRELQRVQWPDRQQVVQATGVVIGFVIVAGAFLALADWVAGKLVHFLIGS